jgi:hypothetical protein
MLEISGSSFVANGDVQVGEGSSEADASGPQPVICVGAECNNGNFTCAEYLSYAVTVKKVTIQQECLGYSLEFHATINDFTFFNLPENVTTAIGDGSLIADLCPAECSGVVSQVKSPVLQIQPYIVAISYRAWEDTKLWHGICPLSHCREDTST